jgi:MFS family permease
MALYALLPLIASQRLRLAVDGYGALFGAFGAGAIVAAVLLGRIKGRLSANGLLAVAGVLYATASAALVLLPGFPAALATLLLAGIAWMAATSTLAAELQLFLPAWVRARGLAVYTVTFTGSMTGGALLWGLVAQAAGLRATFLIAAGVGLAGVVAGVLWRVPDTGHLDPQPVVYWPAARLAYDPEGDSGAILVTVEFTVAPERETAFFEAMEQLRRSRRRTGASRWDLYRDGDRPNHFIEVFSVPSWEEHLSQHEGRLTATDKAIEQTALAFSDPPTRAQHLLPPSSRSIGPNASDQPLP